MLKVQLEISVIQTLVNASAWRILQVHAVMFAMKDIIDFLAVLVSVKPMRFSPFKPNVKNQIHINLCA